MPDLAADKLLRELLEAAGPPGCEGAVIELIQQKLEARYETFIDKIGNLIVRVRGVGTRVLVTCHVDEIGFCIKRIDDNGFGWLKPLGLVDPRALHGRAVRVQTDSATVQATIQHIGRPIHFATHSELSQIPTLEDFFLEPLDNSAEPTQLGNTVTYAPFFQSAGSLVSSKALDNRAGVWAALEMLLTLQHPVPCELWVAFTVEEETGGRGAAAAALHVRPDVAIIVDTVPAGDAPTLAAEESHAALGAGPVMVIGDATVSHSRRLAKLVKNAAHAAQIPLQTLVFSKGTSEATAIQAIHPVGETIHLGIAVRHLHSPHETASLQDMQSLHMLLKAVLSRELG